MSFSIGPVRFCMRGPFQYDPESISLTNQVIELWEKNHVINASFTAALSHVENYFLSNSKAVDEKNHFGYTALVLARRSKITPLVTMLQKYYPQVLSAQADDAEL